MDDNDKERQPDMPKDTFELLGCHSGTSNDLEHAMKVIYRAENAIDANLLRDSLEQEGIMAFVNGEFLQGGVGELPLWGLVSVSVADSDLESAMSVVAGFQKKLEAAPKEGDGRWDPCEQLLDWK